MIGFFIVAAAVYVAGSLFYIHTLLRQLRGYEHVWQQIESVADKNQDGTFTLDVKHLEETHQDNFEAHATETPSGIRLLDLEGLQPRMPSNVGPNRAA